MAGQHQQCRCGLGDRCQRSDVAEKCKLGLLIRGGVVIRKRIRRKCIQNQRLVQFRGIKSGLRKIPEIQRSELGARCVVGGALDAEYILIVVIVVIDEHHDVGNTVIAALDGIEVEPAVEVG
jgi:hypothetical protein